ncbi:MAG: glutamine amidotransferase [Agrobacterium fabrum]|jgi:putative intracellular protease/amidase|uniref:Glutamine amidotransferase n=1 Tax=Agrobacterium fabrum TaxID=1176649 RepID=A0A2W5F5J3_9HYPH|nr:MAG: glutamine amidotransferase [Agrobacterium fabrum]
MTRIAIALAQDFADWEPALLAAAARSYLGVEIVYATPDGAPVISMGGLKVTPDTSYGALDPENVDALIIPGGLSWEKGTAVDLGGLVHRFRDRDRMVAGICAAASALGGTGVLNGVAHTGNSLASHKAYPAYGGEALYRDQPKAVSDGGIVTAAGSAPVSFAVEILKHLGLFGPEAEAELQVFAAEHR